MSNKRSILHSKIFNKENQELKKMPKDERNSDDTANILNGNKRRLRATDISIPQDFSHVVHVAPRPVELIDLNDPCVKQFLLKAGVTDSQLKKPEIYDTVATFINMHGIERIRTEVLLDKEEGFNDKVEEPKSEIEHSREHDECDSVQQIDPHPDSDTGQVVDRKTTNSSSDSSSEEEQIRHEDTSILRSPPTKGALPSKLAVWLRTKRNNKQKHDQIQDDKKTDDVPKLSKQAKKMLIKTSPKNKKREVNSDSSSNYNKIASLKNLFVRKRNSFISNKVEKDKTSSREIDDEIENSSLETIPKQFDFPVESTNFQESNCTIEQTDILAPPETVELIRNMDEIELRTVDICKDIASSSSSASDAVFKESSSSTYSVSSKRDSTKSEKSVSERDQIPESPRGLNNSKPEDILKVDHCNYDELSTSYFEYQSTEKEIQNMRKSWSSVMVELKQHLPIDKNNEESIKVGAVDIELRQKREKANGFVHYYSEHSTLTSSSEDKSTSDSIIASDDASNTTSSNSLSTNNTNENSSPVLLVKYEDECNSETDDSCVTRETVSSRKYSSSSGNEASTIESNNTSDEEEKQISNMQDTQVSNSYLKAAASMENVVGHLFTETNDLLKLSVSSESSENTNTLETNNIVYSYEIKETKNQCDSSISLTNDEKNALKLDRDSTDISTPFKKISQSTYENRPLSASSFVLQPISIEEKVNFTTSFESLQDIDSKTKNKIRTPRQIKKGSKIESLDATTPHMISNKIKSSFLGNEDQMLLLRNQDLGVLQSKDTENQTFSSEKQIIPTFNYLSSQTTSVPQTKIKHSTTYSTENMILQGRYCNSARRTNSQPIYSPASSLGEENILMRSHESESINQSEKRVSVERNASYHRAIETEQSKSLEAAALRVCLKGEGRNRASRIPRPILKSTKRHTIDVLLPTHRVTEL